MILPSVRAFLDGLIDYAGLFPPAKLPLDRAIGNYVKYRAGRDAWMLGRFVIPAAHLAALDDFAHLFSSGPPLSFSVLGRGGDTVETFRAGVEADREAVAAFRARHGAAAVVDAFEVKLPAEAMLSAAADSLLGPTEALRLAGMGVFCEVPATCPPSVFARLRGCAAGVKLRCGGLEAAAFPGPEQVALVIAACRDNGLPLKFTAGLHHPIRHFDRGVPAKMHGFLNVFGAGVLAHVLNLTAEQVREIVEDEDPSHFGFDELGFGWKQYHALTEEVIAARRELRRLLRQLQLRRAARRPAGAGHPEVTRSVRWTRPTTRPCAPGFPSPRSRISPYRTCLTGCSAATTATWPRVGVAIGEHVLDLSALAGAGLLRRRNRPSSVFRGPASTCS